MRILLVCKRHYTNNDLLANRFGRLYHLPLHWSHEADVRVICLDYKSATPESLREDRLEILSLPARPAQLPGSLRRLWRDVDAFAPHVLVASSDIAYGLLGLALARHARVPLAYDLYDDYRAFRINRLTGLAAAFLPICRRADLLICASAPLSEALGSVNPHRLVAGNGYDPDVFRTDGPRAARALLGIAAEELLLIYPGGPAHHLDLPLLARALDRLNASRIPTRCLLVGPDSVRAAGLSPYLLAHPRVSQQQLVPLLRAADIGIAPYRATPQSRVSAPCKIAEFLACGLPCVAAEISDVARWRDHGVVLYPPGDVEAFVACITRLHRDRPAVTPIDELRWDSLAQATGSALRDLVHAR